MEWDQSGGKNGRGGKEYVVHEVWRLDSVALKRFVRKTSDHIRPRGCHETTASEPSFLQTFWDPHCPQTPP